MRHRTVLALVLAALTFGAAPATARPAAPSIVGTWQVIEWWVRDARSGDRQCPYGRQPTGYYVFDATGRVFAHVAREAAGSRLEPGRWRTLQAEDLRQIPTSRSGSGTP